MDERGKLLLKAHETKNKEDWNLYKKSKNLCTNKLRTAKRHYYQNLLSDNSNSPSGFWNAIKEIFQANVKFILKLTTLSVQIRLVNIFLQLLIYLEGLTKRQLVHDTIS